MPIIQFSHANGFPAESYQHLFKHLAPYKVRYVSKFGMGKHQIKNNWQPLVDELIEDIESRNSAPVIGVGHSLGGVLTLWAAIKRPELFSQILLLDPPIFHPLKRYPMYIAGLLGLAGKVVPPAKKAKRRKQTFTNRQEAYEYWKSKRFFQRFNPQSFQDYVTHGVVPSNNGQSVELAIPAALEYRIFCLTPHIIGNTKPKMPSYFLHAPQGDVLDANDVRWLKRNFTQTAFSPIKNGGHMFPLEHPMETAELIKAMIAKGEVQLQH